jgi:hypothetical protein
MERSLPSVELNRQCGPAWECPLDLPLGMSGTDAVPRAAGRCGPPPAARRDQAFTLLTTLRRMISSAAPPITYPTLVRIDVT